MRKIAVKTRMPSRFNQIGVEPYQQADANSVFVSCKAPMEKYWLKAYLVHNLDGIILALLRNFHPASKGATSLVGKWKYRYPK